MHTDQELHMPPRILGAHNGRVSSAEDGCLLLHWLPWDGRPVCGGRGGYVDLCTAVSRRLPHQAMNPSCGAGAGSGPGR
jgi:hypothetical protein